MTELEKAIVRAVEESIVVASTKFSTWCSHLDAGDWVAGDFVVTIEGRVDLADLARRIALVVTPPIDVVAVHEKHIRGLAVTYGLDVDEESIAAAHAVANEMIPICETVPLPLEKPTNSGSDRDEDVGR